MSKHISPSAFYELPSGNKVYPARLIHKDGTLMWRHACDYAVPTEEAHEQHIIKTAQRLEELNSWVSRDLEVWQCLVPVYWFTPASDELSTGYSVYFKHSVFDNARTYHCLSSHVLPHETLDIRENLLMFKRC